jgi:hypothetical protein
MTTELNRRESDIQPEPRPEEISQGRLTVAPACCVRVRY